MSSSKGVPPAGSGHSAEPEPISVVSAVPASVPNAARFADQWWEFLNLKSLWEDGFCDLLSDGQDYDRFGTDDYDCSLEIYDATDDWRLTEPQQRYLSEAGFAKVYVNHKDGRQTHYTFWRDGKRECPVRGWRRRYVQDAASGYDRIIVGEPDPGFWEISYWPDSWNSPQMLADLHRGYYRVVADPLDPFDAIAMEARRGETAETGSTAEGGDSAGRNGIAQGVSQ